MNRLLMSQLDPTCAHQSTHLAVRVAQRCSVDVKRQAALFASLARQHHERQQLEAAGSAPGLPGRVVLAASIISILLASAVLANLVAHLLPGIVLHTFR